MEDIGLLHRFGVAPATGLPVGLQREFACGGEKQELLAGVRTFAPAALAGGAPDAGPGDRRHLVALGERYA